MLKKVKTMAAVAALGMATLGIYGGSTFAADNTITPQKVVPATMNQSSQVVEPTLAKLKPSRAHVERCRVVLTRRHHSRMPWRLGLNHRKQLTMANAKTITEAALLMRGRHDLQVGKIKTDHNRRGQLVYLISINNADNQTVSHVIMNSGTGKIRPMR